MEGFQTPVVGSADRFERLLWIGAIGLWFIGDLFTTLLGIRMGLSEGSPHIIVLALYSGVDGIVILIVGKLLLLCIGGLLFLKIIHPIRIIIPTMFSILGVGVVSWNLRMILLSMN